MTADILKAILVDIYPPKIDFKLILTDRIYKKRLGTYYVGQHLIYVHGGRGGDDFAIRVAIHEYAHHIHNTEGEGKRQKAHGREFQTINQALLRKAFQKGWLGQCELMKRNTNKNILL
jgi:hypothetical protein